MTYIRTRKFKMTEIKLSQEDIRALTDYVKLLIEIEASNTSQQI